MSSYLGCGYILGGLCTWRAFNLVGYSFPLIHAWMKARRMHKAKRGGLGA
jgi:hypothetical protein